MIHKTAVPRLNVVAALCFFIQARYCKPNTTLARRSGQSAHDVISPDFSDWQVTISPDAVEKYIQQKEVSNEGPKRKQQENVSMTHRLRNPIRC